MEGLIGFILMVFGIIACGITVGTMYNAQIGWLVIGGGAIILGLLVFVLAYLDEKQKGAN